MPDLHLALRFPMFVVLLAAFFGAGLAWFAYRTTIPPISPQIRSLLIILRAVGLFLVILLIGEPLLSLIQHNTEQPAVLVLVDNSKSMGIRDRQGDRKEEVLSVLGSGALRQLAARGTIRYAAFDTRLRMLSSFSTDSITLSGDGTDLAAAFGELKRQVLTGNVQSVVMITDGNSTTGANPMYEAEDLGLPVFTIGVGDTSTQKDVLVRSVLSNEISYVGSKVPVNARIRSSGLGGERVEVTLQQNGSVLDRKMIVLESGNHEYPVELSFVPQTEGLQKYTIDVSRVPGELTERNNRAAFFTKVLRSKLNVVMVAGGPSPDVAFIRRSLESDKNVSVKSFIEKNDGRFLEGTLSPQLLKESDCIVLVGFPTSSSAQATLAMVLDAATNGKPVLAILSRTIDARRFNVLEAVLPCSIQHWTGNEFEIFISIPDAERTNPLVKRSEGPFEAWQKLPPLFRPQASIRLKPEVDVIARARLQSTPLDDPMIASRSVVGNKSVAVLGYGLWRWKLLSDPGTETLLDEFLSNTVRWLSTREDDKRARVRPIREVFTTQDAVEFSGQVYDEKYQPIDDAQVTVTVRRGQEHSSIELTPLTNGQYSGSFDPLEEGDYAFTATVTESGRTLGEEKGTFSVGGLNAEFIDTKMNRTLLQQMADRTGGKYYDASNIRALPNDVASQPNFKSRDVTKASEIELWHSGWMLGLAVFFFAVEWFTRKRLGML